MLEKILERITDHLRCRLIDGPDGEPYLERYYLFGLLDRHIYLHRFVASDPDRGLHDHPWRRALSMVLTGGYREIRLDSLGRERERRVRPGRVNFLRGEDFHRVLLEPERTAWTLFMHGPRVKGWGFLRNGNYRSMARDAGEFRHRGWWKEAPRGRLVRRQRAKDAMSTG